MRWSNVYVRHAIGYIVVFMLGGIGVYYKFPRTIPGATKTEIRTVTEIVYREVEKETVKNVTKVRKITKKNGDVIKETIKSNKLTEEKAKVNIEKSDNIVKVVENEIPQYGVGIGCNVHFQGFCDNPHINGSVRLGSSDLWLDGSVSKSLDVKLGIRWEF